MTSKRLGEDNSWPEGTILAKVVWKDTRLKEWKNATVPGKFVHVEVMFKDSKRFKKLVAGVGLAG